MGLSRTLCFAVLLAFAGCATSPSVVSDRLFFGRAIPGGGEVTETQWNAFVDEVIVPRFPDGFTVWRGSGHWKGDGGMAASEQTCVLEVVHGTSPTADAKIAEIAKIYLERFKQSAVMRTRSPAEMDFWGQVNGH